MPEFFALKSEENDNDRHPLSTAYDNDRYTPIPDENFNEQKPEIYYVGAKTDSEPIHDGPPYAPFSQPVDNSYFSPRDGPELYHLKLDDDENNNIPNRRLSPALISNNQGSSMPYQNLNEQGPEMYYIQVGGENHRQSLPINNNYQKTKFNDNIIHDDNYDQKKVTMYVLAADQENLPPPSHRERTPSPPIRPAKKQQPVSYDIIDNNSNNKFDKPNKPRPFPAALYDVTPTFRYVPLSQSKASESIQRSMNKYRFGSS